jgi:hypothetical protein
VLSTLPFSIRLIMMIVMGSGVMIIPHPNSTYNHRPRLDFNSRVALTSRAVATPIVRIPWRPSRHVITRHVIIHHLATG